MVRVILSGCSGRMGKVITDLISENPAMEIVAGIDLVKNEQLPYPVFTAFAQCDVAADVIIDFSSPHVFDAMMDFCSEKHVPAVVCTTGLSQEQIARMQEVSAQAAMLRSANMSLGINLIMKLLADAAPVLAGAGFDVEIVEKHHNRKKDAPSGTAIALADAINDSVEEKYTYVYDRSTRYEARDAKELGISAVRGGTIVGDHDVIFAGTDEVITFSHRAYSRALFAKGAVAAAAFLADKQSGMYSMQDVVTGQLA